MKKKYWKFDSGKICEIPEEKDRENLILEFHEKSGHRSMEYVYYDMKLQYYWPGTKATIENVIKKCSICQINNRKCHPKPKYIVTSYPMQKIAIDLMELNIKMHMY